MCYILSLTHLCLLNTPSNYSRTSFAFHSVDNLHIHLIICRLLFSLSMLCIKFIDNKSGLCYIFTPVFYYLDALHFFHCLLTLIWEEQISSSLSIFTGLCKFKSIFHSYLVLNLVINYVTLTWSLHSPLVTIHIT